jgi:hypothetical protein
LRSHWLANTVFISLADVMDACEMAWNRFATNHGLIRSLCAVAWAPASPALSLTPAMEAHSYPEISGDPYELCSLLAFRRLRKRTSPSMRGKYRSFDALALHRILLAEHPLLASNKSHSPMPIILDG